jgi:hypothetical protein
MDVAKKDFSPSSSYNVERGCVFLLWIGEKQTPKQHFSYLLGSPLRIFKDGAYGFYAKTTHLLWKVGGQTVERQRFHQLLRGKTKITPRIFGKMIYLLKRECANWRSRVNYGFQSRHFYEAEFRLFSLPRGFGTEFREFASIFVPRNRIRSCFLFRGRLRNGIPRVLCSAEQPEFRRI